MKKEIAKLTDAKFKVLVFRILREIVEYGCTIEEKVKAMQSDIKENIQGTDSEEKEIRTQINDLDQQEEINSQLEQNEEMRIQKNERLRNLWDNFKCSTIQIIGVPEEEEEQDIENLLEKIMKENSPSCQRK